MYYYKNSLEQQFNYYGLQDAYQSAHLEGRIQAISSILEDIRAHKSNIDFVADASIRANELARLEGAYTEMMERFELTYAEAVEQLKHRLASINELAFSELAMAFEEDDSDEDQGFAAVDSCYA